jgi:hypothetical protein
MFLMQRGLNSLGSDDRGRVRWCPCSVLPQATRTSAGELRRHTEVAARPLTPMHETRLSLRRIHIKSTSAAKTTSMTKGLRERSPVLTIQTQYRFHDIIRPTPQSALATLLKLTGPGSLYDWLPLLRQAKTNVESRTPANRARLVGVLRPCHCETSGYIALSARALRRACRLRLTQRHTRHENVAETSLRAH